MKNKKINLDGLKVKSFVTKFEKEEENTLKGGTGAPCRHTGPLVCQSGTWMCN